MTETIVKKDLLFHPVHGLCRVSTARRSVETKELDYTLVPVSTNRGKIRFVVPASSLESSGFSKLMSAKEGQAILDYFKTGKKAASKDTQAWQLAGLIWSEASSKEAVKDARRRQRIDHAVKGLAGELAYVLEMTAKEVAEQIQKNLGRVSEINPLALTALANIDKR